MQVHGNALNFIRLFAIWTGTVVCSILKIWTPVQPHLYSALVAKCFHKRGYSQYFVQIGRLVSFRAVRLGNEHYVRGIPGATALWLDRHTCNNMISRVMQCLLVYVHYYMVAWYEYTLLSVLCAVTWCTTAQYMAKPPPPLVRLHSGVHVPHGAINVPMYATYLVSTWLTTTVYGTLTVTVRPTLHILRTFT